MKRIVGKVYSSVAIFENTMWLLGDKIFRLGGGLFIGIFVARYLGAEQFGLFNYAFSVVWIFSSICTLGLDELIVREILASPKERYNIVGTAYFLKFVGACFALALLLLLDRYFLRSDLATFQMILIFWLSMLIRTSGVIRLWNESQLKSKINVLVENASFIVASALKLILIFIKAPLSFFVWVVVIEFLIGEILYFFSYVRQGESLREWRFDRALAQNLLKQSWPLVLSGLSILIYVKSDIIILERYLGNSVAGIYVAAARISEMWYFFPTAIVASVFPSIMTAKAQGGQFYSEKIQKLFDVLTVSAVMIAIPVSLFSDTIINLLFGQQYHGAGQILAIHIWAAVFVFLGVGCTKIFLAENLLKFQFYTTLMGAITNVLLNILLVPKFGGIGSAIATVISYGLSVFIVVAFTHTRFIFTQMIASFNFIRIIRTYWLDAKVTD